MSESLFDELKHYVKFGPADEEALRKLHPLMQPHFARVADTFYRRILDHSGARTALEGGESTVGRLKVTLQQWMDELFRGPWDEAYYLRRCRIGRVHVRIALPQHYMFGAMNVIRREFSELVVRFVEDAEEKTAAHSALGRILDLELAVMLHTYREDLVAQAARAERLSTFGQLVGSIGHELRNPLGVIETSLHILRSRPALAEDPRAGKHVERIGEQVELAGRIISDLLDMIRDRPLARAPVALSEVWAASVRAVAHAEGVAVVAEGLDAVPPVSGDAGQLRQVFVNLLQNAVQAVGDAGRVRLSARVDGHDVELAIEDSGPGVAPEVRTRMFEPLITTKSKGIGLGLPLVRRIVERHGGSIHYVPRPEVTGARFVVRLPLQAGASA